MPFIMLCHSKYAPNFMCLHSQVSVERGMSWEEATHAWADQNGADDGFYVQVWKC